MRKFFCIYNIKSHNICLVRYWRQFTSTYYPLQKQQRLFEIIIIIRMRLYFLMVGIVLAACAPGDQRVGGFSQITDKQSKEYTDIVSFVAGQFSELADWNVDSVKSQVVNGINYIVTLSKKGQKAEIKVSSDFSGIMAVTSYTLNQKPQPIPIQVKKNLISIDTAQGQSPIPESAQSENVNSNQQNDTTQNNTQIGKVNDVFLVSNPLILDNSFVGGFRPVHQSQNESYKDAWDSIVKKYPYTELYRIIEVRAQVVAGLNFIFVLQSPQKNKIIVVKVYQSLSHSFKISILQTNTAVGYSADEILAFQRKCVELKSELKQYQLVYISNTQASEGLSFTFLQGSDYVIANCSYKEGNKVVIFQ